MKSSIEVKSFSRAKEGSKRKRPPIVRLHLDPSEITVDNFAGGGGASTGVEWAIGRSPDIAINHCAEALAMHAANHPSTEHMRENVWLVDPVEACKGRKVGLAWFSPTCTQFSKAKGGALAEDAIKIRALCWVAVRWAHRVQPRVIALENVEEFEKYGPLHRTHTHGCKRGETPGTCRASCRYNKSIRNREGELFQRFVQALRDHGYTVEWRQLRACDYGAPTTRKRLFLIARCDGHPIAWPEPTHGPGRPLAWRAASECIEWDVPAPSIFNRKKDWPTAPSGASPAGSRST